MSEDDELNDCKSGIVNGRGEVVVKPDVFEVKNPSSYEFEVKTEKNGEPLP